jgi:ketosteroid isomerase-like protein
MMDVSKNIKLVLEVLNDEIKGDSKAALDKITEDYSMTWMYRSIKGVLFPVSKREENRESFDTDMEEIYQIKDRKYDIKNIAEGENVVMIELVESYTDPVTKQLYRTPQVLVLKIGDNKIKVGRHYCDPQVSYLNLTEEDINKVII